MGIFDVILGNGIETKLKRLDRVIEEGQYDDAEGCLLELRVFVSRKYSPGSSLAVRLDLAEARLRAKYQQFDRVEGPARRAFLAAKGQDDKDLLRQAAEVMIGCAVRGGRYGETVEMAEQWIAVGSSDFKQKVDILITKGAALNQLGRYNDALRSYEAGVRLVEAMPETPDRHERFVTAASGMGDAFLGLDNRPQAINCWRQAMGATRSQYGPDHPQIASILVCIGTVQLNADEIDPACGSFSQALEIFRAAAHGEAMGAAIALQKLALAYLMKGDIPSAMRTAKEAISASSAHGPEMRSEAQELLRKIEDAKIVPPGQMAPARLIKTTPEDLDDLPLVDRTMFPARPANSRPSSRPTRTNINANWAAIGR
jgi:tetratricopeptide (TPR) repeat protein